MRVIGVDAARGVAIIAMLIAHAIPFLPVVPGPIHLVRGQINDVASPLFALVMGAAAAIVLIRDTAAIRSVVPHRDGTSHSRDRRRVIGAFLARNAIRGLILIVLGELLDAAGSWVAIVLQILGLTLILGSPLLLLGTRVLMAVTAVLLVAGPVINAAARSAIPAGGLTAPPPVIAVLNWLVFDPHYRVTGLLLMFLLGAVLVRLDLTRVRTNAGALVAGLVITALAYGTRPLLGLPDPQISGDLPDTVNDLGRTLAVFGAVGLVAVLVTRLPEGGPRRLVSGLLDVLGRVGSVALSVYVAQVGVLLALLAIRPRLDFSTNDWFSALVLSVGLPLVALLWSHLLGAGPIERVLSLATAGLRPTTRVRLDDVAPGRVS